MRQWLVFIDKKKQYIEKLKKELQNIDSLIKVKKEQKNKYETQNAKLYIKLNEYQMKDKESTILTYFILISIILFLLSIFIGYTFIQFKTFFLATIVFNAFQIIGFLGSSKIVKNYFAKKRAEKAEDIEFISKQIQELNQKMMLLDKEYYALFQKKQELFSLVSKEESELQDISMKVLNTLLNLDKESKFSLTYLDELIAQEIKEEPQPVIDTNIKRTLNHLENK